MLEYYTTYDAIYVMHLYNNFS